MQGSLQNKEQVAYQIKTMLELQESMNARVNADWREQNYEWYRAIWVECAELLDHFGWKWWKKQTPDLEQVTLELIDIWHFGLSTLLQHNQSIDQIVEYMYSEITKRNTENKEIEFRLQVETFALNTLQNRHFDIPSFFALMDGIGLSLDSLFKGYVGKNVLNFFRQDYGYQDGTYKKQWNGKEDNEHLVEILDELDPISRSFKSDVYNALKLRYETLDV